MEKSDSPYIAQMARNIEKIREFVGSETYEAFIADEKTQSAVLMQLQQIGELAKRVSPATKAALGQVPWVEVGGFRDVVAHEYYKVQLPVVWTILAKDLEPLMQVLREYLKAHPIPEILGEQRSG